ncbi:MAG: AAA family ATPase [Planctomycetaceae bacterium]|nr:AAA family ATPase [Planctomycetaceae bacterium]
MSDLAELRQQLDDFRRDFGALRTEVGQVIVGQREIIDGTLIALVAGGHVLLEGVPGLGKTLLVRTLADCLRVQFSRVQFTPDLMPADLIGTNVMLEGDDGSRRFQFQRGPLFGNIILADEINRATPKTQSALLEAMQEHCVTVGGETYPLPEPFLVLATQNPLEMEGTYPLPEAQLDRFFVKLDVKYPSAQDLATILDRTTSTEDRKAAGIAHGERVLEMRRLARQIPVADEIRDAAIQMVMATHPENAVAPAAVKRFVRFGASPRGAQAMILYAKVLAILDERVHVAREDLRAAAVPTLGHRLILNFAGQAEHIPPERIIHDILGSVLAAAA